MTRETNTAAGTRNVARPQVLVGDWVGSIQARSLKRTQHAWTLMAQFSSRIDSVLSIMARRAPAT